MPTIRTIIIMLALVLSHNVLRAQNTELKKDSGYVAIAEGGRMYWEAYGEGTPLILVHGHTLDRRMWRQQIPVFAQHYRVITPDMRGYGKSSRQQDGMHVTHVDDLITLMDSLHIDKAHIVGLSMGGFITSEMLALHPERMITCTLASGNLRNRKGPSEPMDSVELAESAKGIQEVLRQGVDNWKKEWIEKLITGGGSNAESIREELTAMVGDWDAFQITHHELRLYYANDALPVLKEKCPAVPTMYLSGENEHKKRSSQLKYTPNWSFVVIPDCGHMSNMEQPGVFNHVVLKFLKGTE